VADALFMDVRHAGQNLSHVVADVVHRYIALVFLGFLDDFLEVRVTEFKDQILHDLAFMVLRVKNVQHLNDVVASL